MESTAERLERENEELRRLVGLLRAQPPSAEVFEAPGANEQLQRRMTSNEQRVERLRAAIAEQEKGLAAYKGQLALFRQGLHGVVRLDEDIFARLQSPGRSSTLEKNVRTLLLALKAGASNEVLLEMIASIKV